MANHLLLLGCRMVLLGVLAYLPVSAHAKCSRIIQVPISPIGQSVIVSGDKVSGVYPDLLRAAESPSTCVFEFSVAPRARLEAMYKDGTLDLLIPATKSPRRDEMGLFVPMIQSRATVISVAAHHPPIQSLKDLLDRRTLRVAVVRGFDFGAAYQDLVKALTAQGRLSEYADIVSVGRMMDEGLIDATVMPPSIFIGATRDDPRTANVDKKLRFEPVKELEWGYSGIYISKTALSKADQLALRKFLEQIAKSSAVWKAFQKYYPPDALEGSMKPLK